MRPSGIGIRQRTHWQRPSLPEKTGAKSSAWWMEKSVRYEVPVPECIMACTNTIWMKRQKNQYPDQIFLMKNMPKKSGRHILQTNTGSRSKSRRFSFIPSETGQDLWSAAADTYQLPWWGWQNCWILKSGFWKTARFLQNMQNRREQITFFVEIMWKVLQKSRKMWIIIMSAWREDIVLIWNA